MKNSKLTALKRSILLSLPIALTTIDAGANQPDAPQNPTVETYSSSAAELFWDRVEDPDGILSYRVYQDGALLQSVDGPSLFLTGLEEGRLYTFTFTASDTLGFESEPSAEYRFRLGEELSIADGTSQPSAGPDASPTAPSTGGSSDAMSSGASNTPANLTGSATTSNTISVNWAAPADPGNYGYNVYLNNEYFSTTFSTDFTFTSLAPQTGYSIYVTAFDNGNFSPRSNTVSATTSASGSTTTDDTPVDMAEVVDMTEPASPIAEEDIVVIPQENPAPAFDFFNADLEFDPEVPTPGGPPTTPKNLRVNLVGNNWVEMNWAPSRDDGSVSAYRIYRDDGVNYTVSSTDGGGDADTNRTLRNFWQTTTFLDCNYTHVRACNDQDTIPEVGATHTYQVSAIDNAGNESPRSNSLTVRFHQEQGASVERFSDPYLDPNDDFLFVTDLSNTANFMDQFDLVFSDEFNGTELDANKWTTRLTWNQEDQNIINGEMQYFVDTQTNPDFGHNPFIMTGETLKISAIRTPPELLDRALGQPFLSGALSTHELRSGQVDEAGNLIADKFATTYGYVEGRIRVGQVSGMLTSFYLFRRWEAEHSPEIDIIEYLGENPFGEEKAFQTYHYRDTVHGNILSSPTMQYPREAGLYGSRADLNDFHTYGVLWEPNLVIWYIDGEEVQRLTGPQISRQNMNIILYLVTGSAWAPRPSDSAPFPLEMEVDYVRAFKRKPWNP